MGIELLALDQWDESLKHGASDSISRSGNVIAVIDEKKLRATRLPGPALIPHTFELSNGSDGRGVNVIFDLTCEDDDLRGECAGRGVGLIGAPKPKPADSRAIARMLECPCLILLRQWS